MPPRKPTPEIPTPMSSMRQGNTISPLAAALAAGAPPPTRKPVGGRASEPLAAAAASLPAAKPPSSKHGDVSKASTLPGKAGRTSAAAAVQPSAAAAAVPTASEIPLPHLSEETFRGDFKVAALTSKIAEPVLDAYHQRLAAAAARVPGSRPANIATESLVATEQLLGQFERAGKELARLQQQVDQHVQTLQADLSREEEEYQVQIAALERGIAQAQGSFQHLDQQMARVGQTATRLGDRLQGAEGFRTRAQGAMKAIRGLQEFAAADSLSQLPQELQDPERLAEAAAWTRQLLTLALEVSSSRERVGLNDEAADRPPGELAPKGSIERAVQQLEAFRGQLETRVITQFDHAVRQGDLGAMAECAGVMSEFKRGEAALVQRYISTRPMFTDAKSLAVGQTDPKVTDASSAITAMRSLNGLFKSLVQAVKDEAIIMEQVFPAPATAMAMLVTRVMEQRVQAAVARVLTPPAPDATAEALQMHLKLLAEVFKRTAALAEALQEAVGEGAGVPQMAEAAFTDLLADYPQPELAWLERMHAARPRTPLTAQPPAELFAWNAEAVERCAVLSPPDRCAANVRQLFHGSTLQRTSSGCLLEQIAGHLIEGLNQAAEACAKASMAPYGALTVGAITRSGVAKAAFTVVAEGLGRLLEAVSMATTVVRQLQAHYAKVIEPLVAESPAEAGSCGTGLAALVRAVEDRVLATLQAGLNAFFGQVDRCLTTEQKRLDFRPPEDQAPPLDRPTDACQLAVALLAALAKAVPSTLHGSNLAAFNGEVGRRMHALLVAHMQRYSYSPTGALRWKRDVTEYADCLRELALPAVNERFEELAGLLNILVVAPESLLGLVDGSLRMAHQQALRFVRLREDAKTARVGGQPLLAAFSAD